MEYQHQSRGGAFPDPRTALLDPAALLTLFASTARKILEEKDIRRVFQAICEEACRVLRAERAMVTKVHFEGEAIRRQVAYAHNYPAEFIEAVEASRAPSILGEVIRSGKVQAVRSIKSDSRVFDLETIRRAGHQSVCFIPLLNHEREAYGALVIDHLNEYEYGPEDLKLAEAFGELASIAIENSRLHEEARRSRDFFRSVVDDNAEAIIITDNERRVICWNEGAERLYGYSEAEAFGRSVLDLIVLKDEKNDFGLKYEEQLNGLAREGKWHLAETQRRRKDGDVVSVELAISPIKNDRGEVVAICGFSKDLTERKRAEEALIEAKVSAERANQAKSEFLSNVSHELRSPLNSVIGFSELLMQKTKDEDVLRFLPKIRDAGKYLASLIDDLRDINRIETSRMKLEYQEVKLNDLVEGVIESWSANLKPGFLLKADLDPGCGIIACDPLRIRQILNNLLDNAIKYSVEPDTIIVQTQSKASELWISVRDRGLGLGPDEREVVFDRFRQLDRGPAYSPGGLGIGLYLVRQLLAMHEGRIWVDSEKGLGSTFTFSLPRKSVEDGLLGPPASAQTVTANTGEEPWVGRTVLLVDDLEIFHVYIKMLMCNAEAVHSAYNGEEGVEMAQRLRPDIILMDLRMPALNGYEAIKRLKGDPGTRDIPVLAVTAQAMEQDQERCVLVGAEGCVTKPIDREVLTLEVGRLLRKD